MRDLVVIGLRSATREEIKAWQTKGYSTNDFTRAGCRFLTTEF